LNDENIASSIEIGTSFEEGARVCREARDPAAAHEGFGPLRRRAATVSRILVVDDETRITNFVSRALAAEGFAVETAENGTDGLKLARSGRFDLVVLDLLMQPLDGVSVLKNLLASRPEQPVLVLSAISDIRAKVRCLQLGADDYLAKPFDLTELVLRVRARLRHPATAPPDRLTAGGVTLDLRRRTADIGKVSVSLSSREFLLLQHLMLQQGQVCSREELLAHVWGYTFDPGTNVIDVYVSRLRAKLGAGIIETVRNVGYCFDGS
jgi:two-component system OmpR family response regulator